MPTSLKTIRAELRGLADPDRALASKRYFRAGPGEYGEGDVFLGLSVPQTRLLARKHKDVPAALRLALLRSRIHEERLLALFLMVRAYEKGDAAVRQAVFKAYLDNRRYVNNWDLVDSSAPNIVGAWLLEEGGLKRQPKLLETLARSESLWDRRIAVLATFRFIKAGRLEPTLKLAGLLVGDPEDLIHKAVGWMLQELGDRDRPAEEAFLQRHCLTMPRTMLRYAIEKFPEARRKAWLKGKP